MQPTAINVGAATERADDAGLVARREDASSSSCRRRSRAWSGTHGTPRNDDDHIFGGSLYTMPYSGNGQFGAPTPLLTSARREQLLPELLARRAAHRLRPRRRTTRSVATHRRLHRHGAAPDLPERQLLEPGRARSCSCRARRARRPSTSRAANGSPAASPRRAVELVAASGRRSCRRYQGDKLLWIAFSSTRDYGLRVRNHQPGMYQCYPPDSYERPGRRSTARRSTRRASSRSSGWRRSTCRRPSRR